MTMQNQPGDALLTGQVDGQKVGQAFFQLLPSMPFEGPPFLPRFMARQLFPGGFLRQQPALPEVLQVPPTIVAPPAAAPVQPPAPPVAAAQANRVLRTQVIPQPAPAGGYRSAAQGGEPISVARSQRVRIRERPGL